MWSAPAPAFDLYWDGGAGTWSSGEWLNANNQAVGWANGFVAVFNGASGGAVTVSGRSAPPKLNSRPTATG